MKALLNSEFGQQFKLIWRFKGKTVYSYGEVRYGTIHVLESDAGHPMGVMPFDVLIKNMSFQGYTRT